MYISEINIYPVKSLAGISLTGSIVEDRGLRHDRRYLLIDEHNRFLTQREHAGMALIHVGLLENGLEISTGGREDLFIPDNFESAETTQVQIWRNTCAALVAGSKINEWFSDVLDFKCRLVKMPETTRRPINEKFNKGGEVVSFADGYPILIISEASLADLNARLERELPMNRFRPNIVVSGAASFAEDRWSKIRIGETVLRATKPCARCVITTIDQTTGIADIKEPLKTLAAYRKSSDVFPETFEKLGLGANDVLFGQNLVPENFGRKIKVGDEIEIIES